LEIKTKHFLFHGKSYVNQQFELLKNIENIWKHLTAHISSFSVGTDTSESNYQEWFEEDPRGFYLQLRGFLSQPFLFLFRGFLSRPLLFLFI